MSTLDLDADAPAAPVSTTSVVGGAVRAGVVAGLASYAMLHVAIWLAGRPQPEELGLLRGALMSAGFLTIVLTPYGLWLAAAERRLILYFGPMWRLRDGGGFAKLVQIECEPLEFVEKLRALVSRSYRVTFPTGAACYDHGFSCRINAGGGFSFDVEVLRMADEQWSISARRCDLFKWPLRFSRVEVAAAQVLGSLLLLAERNHLMTAGFGPSIPRERILKEFRKTPFLARAALGNSIE